MLTNMCHLQLRNTIAYFSSSLFQDSFPFLHFGSTEGKKKTQFVNPRKDTFLPLWTLSN